MARFAREAQFLAALNHPNIGSIYGFEESSTMLALVMELVEGPTLADRIAQGPVPIEDALPIMKQITEALEYAHERGIVHRDLKPANIKIKPDGTVKVLDFGLAKALSDESNPDRHLEFPDTNCCGNQSRIDSWHCRIYVAGTSSRKSGGSSRGYLVFRRSRVRDAYRQNGFQRRYRFGHFGCGHSR